MNDEADPDRSQRRPDGAPGPAHVGRPHRFERLLAIIVLTFFVSGFSGRWAVIVSTVLIALLVVVAFRLTSLRTTNPRLAVLLSIMLAAVAATVVLNDSSRWFAAPAFALAAVLAALVLALLAAVLRRRTVDAQTLIGAISAYAMIGLAYSWLYLALDTINDGQLSIPAGDPTQFPTFSFVVLTTLGFGNQVPNEPLASRVVVTEAVLGQIFLATFVARLVALYGQQLPSRKR